MPGESEGADKDKKSQFMNALFEKHDYTSMFAEGSISENRSLRWINVCLAMMVGLMIDTLFFSLFYADTGTCEALSVEADCLSLVNKASNSNLCSWTADDGGSCALISPPSTITFTVIILLITVIIGVP
eukprot:gene47435-biopygen17706